MAVYTTLEADDIEAFIKPFGIGRLVEYQGISEGMENTNYFVTTSSNHLAVETAADQPGHYVLTIFEELPADHLPFHIQLLNVLADKQIPVAAPIRDYNGASMRHLQGKPAILCPRLPGKHPTTPTLAQCQAIGTVLADMHAATASMDSTHAGIRDVNWLKQTVQKAMPELELADQQQVQQTLDDYLALLDKGELERGFIHGDLFRDNSLFEDDKLTGLIDFYNAGLGHLLYDLAVVVNDWCTDEEGHIYMPRFEAIVNAYQQKRPFTDAEKAGLPVIVKTAAMRFWLSRILALKAHENKNTHELRTFKDPNQFKQIFERYVHQGVPALA